MTTSPFTTDASALLPGTDIWFALPAGFTPLPVRELLPSGIAAGPPDSGGVGGVLSSLLTVVEDPGERQRLLVALAPVRRMVHALLATGVIQCSIGLHADDEGDGRLLASLFTLAWRKVPWAPRSVLAARAAAAAQNAVHMEMLDLPCGPGALVETPVDLPGSGPEQRLLQISAYVPYPDGERLAILNLATPETERAQQYRVLLHEIACLVSFDNPFSPECDKE